MSGRQNAVSAKALLRHWRVKAVLQKALSPLPLHQRLNYLLQRRVVRSIPVNEQRLADAVQYGRRHFEAHLQHGSTGNAPADATFFEFGAGWDLRIPVVLFALGVRAQIVVDRSRHVRGALIADVASRLAARAVDVGLKPERIGLAVEACLRAEGIEAKAACFGISYRAPCDARATGLGDASVDCVTSTSTLEHIPPVDIALILAECHRILRPGGVASFIIDYSDHYAHFDRSLTRYNFLGYSERHWRLYNSALQYQNRLRHCEYVALVRRSGFEVVSEGPSAVGEAQRAALASVRLDDAFRSRDPDDLAVTGSHMVLRR